MKNIQLAIIALFLSISVSTLLYAEETAETPEQTTAEATVDTEEAAEEIEAETEGEEEVEAEAKEEEVEADAEEEEVEADAEEVEVEADAEEVEEDVEEAEEEGEEEEYDEDTYGPEAPIIWMHPVKGVAFVHKIHTMDAGLDCDACHDDFFEMEAGAAEEKEDFIMETIYEGGYCGACHDGDSAFAANTQCATCHIGVMGAMRENGETEEAGH